MSRPVVATIAFDGMSPFHISVPCLIFGEDRSRLGLPRFEFRVCTPLPGAPLRTESGLELMAPYGLDGLVGADIVIVPTWHDVEAPPPRSLVRALTEAHAAGAIVVGLCLGAFVLGAAGLLDGREATTHWAAAERLAAMYPRANVRPDVLYVDTGTVVTSAGVAAALDCCLHILRRLYGADPTRRVARSLVLPPHRQGGQAQFIERPLASRAENDALARALDAVLVSLHDSHSLDSVAALACMSRRTFTRRFGQRTGMSFSRWLSEQRVLRAQELLETTTHSVEEVARQCGFGTATSLRQHFAARLATSPLKYRREFALGA